VEAVSILGAPRKPTCEWRRRDFGGDAASEAQSCRERDSVRGSGVQKHQRPGARVKYLSSSPHGPPKRVQRVVKRRILRSHRSQGRTSRSETGSAGTGQAGSGWQKSVGHIAGLTRKSWVPSPREVGVALNARVGTSEGETVCKRLAATFTGSHGVLGRRVMNASGPDTTEGVLDRSSARSSPGVREAVLARR